jgi:hypothetical protein
MAMPFARRMPSLCPWDRSVYYMPLNAAAPPRWVVIWSAAISAATNGTHTTRVQTAIAPSASL